MATKLEKPIKREIGRLPDPTCSQCGNGLGLDSQEWTGIWSAEGMEYRKKGSRTERFFVPQRDILNLAITRGFKTGAIAKAKPPELRADDELFVELGRYFAQQRKDASGAGVPEKDLEPRFLRMAKKVEKRAARPSA